MACAKRSHWASWLAAMLMSPSRVVKLPDGAEVGFSLPQACGLVPAWRKLLMTQPMVLIRLSSMETSINCAVFLCNAADMAIAAVSPPTVSAMG